MHKVFPKRAVFLGTGGTIAGQATDPLDCVGYIAAQVGVAQLLDAVPALARALGDVALHAEQVAQIDSKDMGFSVWVELLRRVIHHLEQPEVVGIIVTHGTDTLEETAFFLESMLPGPLLAAKPVVLTCAMRPASALVPDGPQNLLDAVALLSTPGACGVTVVCAGEVHTARDVQKAHTYRLNAFSSGDAGVLGYIEEGVLRQLRNWPLAHMNQAQAAIETVADGRRWPRVDIVMSCVDGSADMVDALLAQSGCTNSRLPPLRGLVVAATGNGSVHGALQQALLRAANQGVQVVIASRCASGRVIARSGSVFKDSQGLSPVKARIALLLALMA